MNENKNSEGKPEVLTESNECHWGKLNGLSDSEVSAIWDELLRTQPQFSKYRKPSQPWPQKSQLDWAGLVDFI
jgi:hypothetical protein